MLANVIMATILAFASEGLIPEFGVKVTMNVMG